MTDTVSASDAISIVFVAGFAAACADLARSGEDGHARNLLENAGITRDMLRRSAVGDMNDLYDLDALGPVFDDMEASERIAAAAGNGGR